MKKGFATSIAFCALAFLAASSAHADSQPMPFSYRVKAPASAASCADHATGVAAGFAAGTRAQQVSGACESRQTIVDHGTQYSVDVMVVNYLATSEVTPTRSVFGGNGFLNNGDATAGVFRTYGECLNQLAAQSPLFIAQTGVTPIVGYCTASSQQEFYPGFSLTFESFGTLKNQLYTFADDGVPSDDHSQVTRAAIAAIQASGGYVAWSDANRVFYYNDGAISVSTQNLGSFEVAQQCTSQLAQAQAIFVNAGLAGVSSFCRTDTPVAGHSFYVLMVVGAGSNEIMDNESDRYETFAECAGDLNRILGNSASTGRTVYGGLCSPSLTASDGFNAHVYIGLN